MKETKKLTIGAMMIAIGVAFMALGAYVEALDLTVAALLSLVVAFVCIELGSPYIWIVWLGTSLLGAVFFTGSFVWITYFLIFGLYPILKGLIERLRLKWLWILVKLAVFNVMLPLLMLASQYIIGIPLFALEGVFKDNVFVLIGLYLLCNVAFFLYDVFMTVMIRAYLERFRPRFSQFLK
jgi:hypothetical protein